MLPVMPFINVSREFFYPKWVLPNKGLNLQNKCVVFITKKNGYVAVNCLRSISEATVHTNPSRKRCFSKTLLNSEEFENASFSFSHGRKTI